MPHNDTRKLLPVLRPCQNMRDIIKQMALLEDHMFQPTKRCKDCIRKHFLTIEGLAEECATLCKPTAILPETRDITSNVRILHHAWEHRPKDAVMNEHVAGRLRKMRKNLMKKYAALPVDKLPSKETAAVMAIVDQVSNSPKNTARKPNKTLKKAVKVPLRKMPRVKKLRRRR